MARRGRPRVDGTEFYERSGIWYATHRDGSSGRRDGRGNYRVYDPGNLEEYDDLRFTSADDAYSLCDRANLLAVLEAIREPRPAACMAAVMWQEDPANDDG